MIKIILIGTFCMYLLIYHPGWVLLAGLIVGGFVIMRKYNLTPAEDSKDREEDFFTTYEERIEREMSRLKFKKDFEKNPEWQKQAKKVRDHIEKARASEDAAMRAEGQNIKNMA